MQIHALTLDNFRSYHQAGFVFDQPVTFLIGRNGAGKSSALDAIVWGLLGRCRGTDAAGRGSDGLLRAGGTPAPLRVQLDLTRDGADVVRLERTQSARSSTVTFGDQGGKDAAGAALRGWLKASPAVVEACLSSEAFLALHHAEAKKLLLEILDVRVVVDGQPLTLPEVEAQYKHWFEVRRQRKADLAAVATVEAPLGELPNLADIEARLTALREDEKRLLAASAEALGRRAELQHQHAHVTAAIAKARTALADAGPVVGLDGAKVHLSDGLAEIAARLTALEDEDGDQQADQARVTLIDAQGRLKTIGDTHVSLAAHSPDRGCVLNAAIPCKTPAKYFSGEITTLQDQIAQLQGQVAEAEGVVAHAKARAVERRQLEARRDEWQRMATARAKVAGDLETLEATAERLLAERAALPEDDRADRDGALDALRERIAKGEGVRREAEALIRQAQDAQRAAAQRQSAATALGEAERLVDLLGPNGARVDALQHGLARFTADINVSLERFGYHLALHLDPWRVVVNGLPAELLSASERLRVGIALQLAIAEASGVGVVAIDQVDLLDAGNRALLGEVLSLRGGVQVLAAATKEDDWTPPEIEGWAWIRIAKVDGMSQVVPIAEAVPA